MAAHTEHRLQALLNQELDDLAAKTNIRARVITPPARRAAPGPDAVIEFQVNGKKHRRFVEIKRIDRLAALGHAKAQIQRWNKPAVLFAPYITPTMAEQCRTLDLQFLDGAGNAYLKLPGAYVYITGEKPRGTEATVIGAKGGGTATALRVVFVLLCNPTLLNAPYREIVQAAGVALGAVGWVFFDLEKRGYIVGNLRKRNRRFLEPVRLFEEWVTNYAIKLRPRLNVRRFRAENPKWWQTADLAEIGAYWGGEVAAERLTRHLKPATYTIYLPNQRTGHKLNPKEALTDLVITHRLRADPTGNIEVLDAFWNLPRPNHNADVVPAILAYADLVATNDPRNIEAARLLREQHIDHAFGPA